MKQLNIGLLFTLAIGVMSGCGGSDTQTGPDVPSDVQPDENEDPSDNSADNRGQYDLAEYLFPEEVLASDGDVSFTEIHFAQDTGEPIMSIPRRFTNSDGVTINEFSFSERIKTFSVNQTSIEETLLDLDSAKRDSKRFVDIGDTYMNADYHPPESDPVDISQNASCKLIQHIDNFDMSTAGGNLNLASGVLNDVLKIDCVTSFLADDGQKSPHTTLTHYFAKGIGGIFSEGSVLLVGDVFIVEEY